MPELATEIGRPSPVAILKHLEAALAEVKVIRKARLEHAIAIAIAARKKGGGDG